VRPKILPAEGIVPHAIVVLLEDEESAEAVARILGDLVSDSGRVTACIPPVRGMGFFSSSAVQPQLDAWWDSQIPRDANVIFVVNHRTGLAEWLVGLDGASYVGLASSTRMNEYEHREGIRAFTARSPLDYAAAVMTDLVDDGAYDEVEASRIRSLAAAFNDEIVSDTPASPVHEDADGRAPDPFDLLIAMSLGQADAAAATMRPVSAPSNEGRSVEGRGFRLPAWTRRVSPRRTPSTLSDAELANLLIMRGSTIVAIGSRKGGVGKTSHAAGVAIVAGAALDTVGRCAAIVDANIANPDAWGQLNLPHGAASVRDMIVALAADHDLPRPVHASTPALACFPEARETSEYSRTEIGLFVAHLRSRYPLVIVDMSNRLPDPTAGPEAAAAAYWLEHADVLVLPSATSKQDFNGVLDYLDVRDLPPAIVASLVPRTRRNREHPLAKRYMTAISQRVYRVVDIPDDSERVRYAGMQGVPVEAVSASLRAAYRELAEAIALAPQPVPR
jgi:MinD-like ATPase involved in chromosome partitioning or flagellar assembly